jgi:hypothetical protein
MLIRTGAMSALVRQTVALAVAEAYPQVMLSSSNAGFMIRFDPANMHHANAVANYLLGFVEGYRACWQGANDPELASLSDEITSN